MFTGIVTHIGNVRRIRPGPGGALRMEVESGLPDSALGIGDSVAHDGCCLTVVEAGAEGDTRWHALDVSAETVSRTTLGVWQEGQAVNLEAAARFGDAIGGHHVLGHVDGCGIVETVEARGEDTLLAIDAPAALAPLIAEKGSIAVDGVSLTVNGVTDLEDGARFTINIIPHTSKATVIGGYHPGRRVNLEIDPLARYVARLLAAGPPK